MRRTVTLIIIFFVTSVVAMMATPTGDPFTYIMIHALFLCVAIPCYFIGLHQGRISNKARSQGKSPLGTADRRESLRLSGDLTRTTMALAATTSPPLGRAKKMGNQNRKATKMGSPTSAGSSRKRTRSCSRSLEAIVRMAGIVRREIMPFPSRLRNESGRFHSNVVWRGIPKV